MITTCKSIAVEFSSFITPLYLISKNTFLHFCYLSKAPVEFMQIYNGLRVVSKHKQFFKLIFDTVRHYCVGLLVPFISLCWSEASANSQIFIDRRRVGYITLHDEFVRLLMLGDTSQNRRPK